jgi:hypothetical protein
MIFKFLFIFLFFADSLLSSEHRRIGIRHDVDSSFYYNFWRNDVSYETSNNYPNLSLVGALISNKGHLGTATLVASNYIVTAAHVMKNSYFDDPDPADWQFILHDDYKNTISSSVYQIQTIIIHPGWTARQEYTQRTDGYSLGDGDILGLDLALLQLNRHVRNIFPARLPSESDDPLGLRTVLAGFGVLVNGNTGTENRNNTGLVGGENTIDRSVAEVSVDYQIDQDIQIGGLRMIVLSKPLIFLDLEIASHLQWLLRQVQQMAIAVDLHLLEQVGLGVYMELSHMALQILLMGM